MTISETSFQTKVKICGLKTLEHARFASGAHVDFCGFIFHKPSPRYISPKDAGMIISWLGGPLTVGVFVNEDADEVNNIALLAHLHYVQLHGDESPEYCSLMEKEVIKAFRIKSGMTTADIEAITKPYENCVSFYLFDTYSDESYGGVGQSFDWSILAGFQTNKPFFVAGGINKDNVGEVIRLVDPFGVDVSGSLESEPGEKDFDKMEEFFEKMNDIHEKQITE